MLILLIVDVKVYYHRAQIKKYAMYLLAEWRTCQELLSAPEQDFLKRYADLKESHFDSTVLAAMPAPFNVMGEPEMGMLTKLASRVSGWGLPHRLCLICSDCAQLGGMGVRMRSERCW